MSKIGGGDESVGGDEKLVRNGILIKKLPLNLPKKTLRLIVCSFGEIGCVLGAPQQLSVGCYVGH